MDTQWASREHDKAKKWTLAAMSILVCASLGFMVFHYWFTEILRSGFLKVPGANIFYLLFYRYENMPIFLLGLSALLTGIAWLKLGAFDPEPDAAVRKRPIELLIAIAVGIVVYGGSWVCYDRYPLSMDEYMGEFQAHIFREGVIQAPLPDELRSFRHAALPVFGALDENLGTWMTSYWPGYSALRALFMFVGDSWLLNAVLSAGGVLLIARIARLLMPGIPEAAPAAALLLATSQQFLINGMSAYPITAYLFFNLLWLALYLSPVTWHRLLFPVVGIFCLALHQPTGHAFFALPFLVLMLWTRKFSEILYTIAVYLLGLLWMVSWMLVTRPDATVERAVAIFKAPAVTGYVLQVVNVVISMTWQTAALLLLFILGLANLRRAGSYARALLIGLLLNQCFFAFFISDQGHGWGYRYLGPLLANIVLIALLGLPWLRSLLGRRTFPVLAGSSIISALVLLGFRVPEVQEIVLPFSKASAILAETKADFVIVPSTLLWYGPDLVRNDPFLRDRPILLKDYQMYSIGKRGLNQMRQAKTVLMQPHVLEAAGLTSRLDSEEDSGTTPVPSR